jgi:hypothetical protein
MKNTQKYEGNWWAEFRIFESGGEKYYVPANTPPIQSEVDLSETHWGGFHCKDCADICANYGKTIESTWDFNHGTNDEKFGVFLGGC